MPEKKPVLGLDFDDVLHDFNRGLAGWHNDHYGTDYTREDVVSYHLYELWGIPQTEGNRRIYEFYHSPEHALTPPVEGALCAVPMLEEQYEIVVISARPEAVRGHTREWLGKYFPSLVDKLYLTNRFGAGQEVKKSVFCKQLDVHAFVDDAPHHHQELTKEVPRTILFETPWNRDYAAALKPHQKVRSWYGLAILLS